MPRYFFHIRGAGDYKDEDGVDLADDVAARLHGVRMHGEILYDDPQTFLAADHLRLRATTEEGVVILTVSTTIERG
jgi:hypothetical protein